MIFIFSMEDDDIGFSLTVPIEGVPVTFEGDKFTDKEFMNNEDCTIKTGYEGGAKVALDAVIPKKAQDVAYNIPVAGNVIKKVAENVNVGVKGFGNLLTNLLKVVNDILSQNRRK